MEKTILGLRAETSIHAGTGQNTGVIDLPIQREAHTGWPCVFGAAMKGALRAHAEMRINPKPAWIADIFGPDTNNSAADHAGAIAVTDARLLLLPVRSLTGHFKWVTCPAVLERLKRDMQLVGLFLVFNIPSTTEGSVVTSCGGFPIFLEEYQLHQIKGELDDLINVLSMFGIEKELLTGQLAVMHNDDFTAFCQSSTAVTPHIAIENNTKTVKPGALWYEETLPPDTLLYTMLLANPSRSSNTMDAGTVLTHVSGMFAGDNAPYFLQVGGNETVGMGWCRVTEVKQ